MPSSNKLKRLREHAKERGYKIDEELTERIRSAYSDAKINIRVPVELKNELVAAANKRNIPYQRYIKSILIEAVTKDKAS